MSVFHNKFKPLEIISGLSRERLRELARHDERKTEYGSASYVSELKSRSAAFTRNTVDGEIRKDDYEVLREIREYLKAQSVIEVDRQMCQGAIASAFACRLWVTKPFARLAHMFHASLGPQNGKKEPDFHVIDVPEFKGERRILADPEAGVTYVLGSDYYGEVKKAFLRMTMYRGKVAGGLGLHAGSKEVWARSAKTGKIERSGMLFFGLSGTGKTSLTCHDYDLNEANQEKCRVRQDDVVILGKDGSARGTEIEGFYIKTEDLNPKDQKALYQAAISPKAILENVFVAEDGKVDFYNYSIAKNGRGIAPVCEVMNTDGDIDMPVANKIFFITRNPLTPPIAKLTAEQASLAFMLGESIKTSAADPNAKGEPVREVGTNPFIVGSKDAEGNRFHEIVQSNPSIQCYLLNTGKLAARKITILETVAILRAVARDAVEWTRDETLRLEVPSKLDGVNMKDLDLRKHLTTGELDDQLSGLRNERRTWLDRFPKLESGIVEHLY